MNSTIGQNVLEQQFQKSVEENDWTESFKILSKNEKFADKFLELITQSDIFHQMATEFMNQMGEVTNSNNKSSDQLFELFKETRSGLQAHLDNNFNELTEEERLQIGQQILEVARMGAQLDANNKAFLLKVAGIIGTPLAVLGAIAITSMANNNQQELTDGDEDDDYY